MNTGIRKILPAVLVASLGYFVDLYDLLLFSVVRTKSLVELGVPETDTAAVGLNLLNWMLASMMVGGVVWGIVGDRKGRLWVLFGSIIMYSFANFLNAYISTVEQYRLLRIIAGFGLAGELGAGITLITEIMKPEKRSFGTMLISAIGMLGAAFAAYIGTHHDWRSAFQLGGVMGFALLFFRFGMKESAVFKNALENNISNGNMLSLFLNRRLLKKYLGSLLLGLPIYYVVGMLTILAPEFGMALGMVETPGAGIAILLCYISVSIGDILYTSISQTIKSRKKTFVIALVFMLFAILFFLYSRPATTNQFYALYVILGLAAGYWVILITNIAEQFGTNYRATATTTAPNFLRGTLIPISFIFSLVKPSLGLVNTTAVIGVCLVVIPFIFLYSVEERFGKPVDWIERS
jgi:putative MFS transporter